MKQKRLYKSTKRAGPENHPRTVFPATYGVDKLILMTRDPWWIYAYWEITPKTERRVLELMRSQKAEGGTRALRVHRESGSEEFFDIEVGIFADNWYVDVGRPDEWWAAELGIRTLDGRFYPFMRSNCVRTPRVSLSDEIDLKWQLPDEVSKKIFDASGAILDLKSSFDLACPSSKEIP